LTPPLRQAVAKCMALYIFTSVYFEDIYCALLLVCLVCFKPCKSVNKPFLDIIQPHVVIILAKTLAYKSRHARGREGRHSWVWRRAKWTH
jgi:hypothetical protein